jgi:hypothetical protein
VQPFASYPFPRLRGKAGMGACLALLTLLTPSTLLASEGHDSAASDLAQIRADLQAGQMRAASAFANLVAGEHPDSSEAIGLLAYVEDRLGYTEKALGRLAAARSKSPADVTLLAATNEILRDHGAAASSEVADAWPAAYSEATGIPIGKQVHVANGFIVDDGTTVITHASVMTKAQGTIVIRNGLGLVRTALMKDSRALAPGLVALKLMMPFPRSSSLDRKAIGDVSQSRFCFALGFQKIDPARFSYPIVAPGMIFRASVGNERLLQVTSALTADQIGSPLFDDQGRLIGMAIGNQSASAAAGYAVKDLGAGNFGLSVEGLRMVPASKPLLKDPAKPAIEELYERLAPAVVQILVSE